MKAAIKFLPSDKGGDNDDQKATWKLDLWVTQASGG